ncbi:histidine phosphatase family protein [Litchfieldella rifensis]|uniref:Histidine phosphatase family protein n=1 Tax=Litchfieldella rifensis TaxID=762643 RepID=A0ABV7LSM5_9GAMM
MRHGHSQANEAGLIVSDPARGVEGFGLSARGEAQLAAVTSDWRWPVPTRVLHSDFLRTTQTAARIADHFGLIMQVEQRLRERFFGEFDTQADTHYPDVWALDAEDAGHQCRGVESVVAVARRMQAVISALEAQYSGETVLLVSHGDPLQILLTAVAGKPLQRHRDHPSLAPASITVLRDAGS